MVVADIKNADGVAEKIHAAGGAATAAAIDTTDAGAWGLLVDQIVNQTGYFYGMRAVIPGMQEGGGGAIEYARSKIGINVICPGIIATPILGDITPELKAYCESQTPLARDG